jgi:hypothetical protein
VAIAKARRAPKLVVQVQVEEPGLTLPTMPPLHILLTHTNARLRVARRRIVQRSPRLTVTRLTPMRTKVEIVGLTPVALVTAHARLALALALRVALQRP